MKNESLYQKQLMNKDEIENKIEGTMAWRNLDDNLRSKIFLRIEVNTMNFINNYNYNQLIYDSSIRQLR